MWRKQNLKSENRKKTDFQTRKSEKKSGFNMLEFEKHWKINVEKMKTYRGHK
jgi:hypothetical protein